MGKNSFRVSILAIVALAVLAMVPSASADSFNLTTNNIGLSGVLGTVTTTQSGSNVNVSIQMSPGYAVLVNGGDLGFTTSEVRAFIDRIEEPAKDDPDLVNRRQRLERLDAVIADLREKRAELVALLVAEHPSDVEE